MSLFCVLTGVYAPFCCISKSLSCGLVADVYASFCSIASSLTDVLVSSPLPLPTLNCFNAYVCSTLFLHYDMAIHHCLKIYCTADFVCITNLEIVNLHRPKTSSTSTRIMSVAHTAYTIKNTVAALSSATCIK